DDITLEAGGAQQREARRLPLGGRQRGVAEAAASAGSDDIALSGDDHVDDDLPRGGLDDRTDGNRELERLSERAGAEVSHAETAVAGGAVRCVVVGQEG